MEISKSAVLLANEHRRDQKKMLQMISYEFSLCIRSRKNDPINSCNCRSIGNSVQKF